MNIVWVLLFVGCISTVLASEPCSPFQFREELNLNFLCLQRLVVSNSVGEINVLTNGEGQNVVILLEGQLTSIASSFSILQDSYGNLANISVFGNLTEDSTTSTSTTGTTSSKFSSSASKTINNFVNVALGAVLTSHFSSGYKTAAAVALGSSFILPYVSAASCTGSARITIIFPEGTTVSQKILSSSSIELEVTSHVAATNCSALNESCISSGDQNTINALFAAGGEGHKVQLCPWAVLEITDSIKCSFPKQELSTFTYPLYSQRATIIVTGATQATAIVVSGDFCEGFQIRNIQINGNRQVLGQYPGGSGLIEMGGYSNNQVVDRVHLYEPRGWSCLHIAEGSLSCRNATISNNDIGPAGYPNGTWADGISIACMDSLVENNIITDTTDGAIVIFGSPGTVVRNNTIIGVSRTLLGGINMVDYGPFNGNYNGTLVINNTINALSAYIKTGIACGPSVWGPGDDYGATVRSNLITGDFMGYGIPASGVSNWTIIDNLSTAKYSGDFDSCVYNNAPPMPFLYSATSEGTFQSDYILGNAVFLICISPGSSSSLTYSTGQLALHSGESIYLHNVTVTLQTNGILVFINTITGETVWSSQISPNWSSTNSFDCSSSECLLTFSNTGLAITSNGTVVNSFITNYNGEFFSASVTFSNIAPYLSLMMLDHEGNILYSSYYVFKTGFSMKVGDFVRVQEGTSVVYLKLGRDANLVVRNNTAIGPALWSTNKTGFTCKSDCQLTFQGDGNLVLYADSGIPFFTATNPNGKFLVLSTKTPYLSITDNAGNLLYPN